MVQQDGKVRPSLTVDFTSRLHVLAQIGTKYVAPPLNYPHVSFNFSDHQVVLHPLGAGDRMTPSVGQGTSPHHDESSPSVQLGRFLG